MYQPILIKVPLQGFVLLSTFRTPDSRFLNVFFSFFENLASVIWTKFIWLVEDYSRNISVKLLSKYLLSNFHFSHYKYMETLSCHSNESTWATTIKNIIYLEANIMNMNIYAKFQLHPSLWLLRRRFLNIFFENLAFRLPWQPSIISDLDKIHMLGRGLIQKHYCKSFLEISAVTQK